MAAYTAPRRAARTPGRRCRRCPPSEHARLGQRRPVERGARVLDLGCGPGHYTRALRRAGASVLPLDLDAREFALPGGPPHGEVVGDGGALPVATAALDGALCSNMLEHTPNRGAVIGELE